MSEVVTFELKTVKLKAKSTKRYPIKYGEPVVVINPDMIESLAKQMKEKGIEFKNPSPFLVTILKMKKQREERERERAKKIVRKLSLKEDKEMRELANG